MLTYGDVMTLLLTFFVLLLSFSSIQEAKFKQAMGALQAALGVLKSEESVLDQPPSERQTTQLTVVDEIEEQMTEMIEIIQDAGLGDEIDVVPTEEGYALRISSPVLFDLASAEIKPIGRETLGRLADHLVDTPYALRVEGHTDNLPIHTEKYPSNWELSTARALSVLKLINSRGIGPKRLSAVGYGEFRPLLANDTPENRQVNRRVEIYVNVKSDDERSTLDDFIGR
jgi:chemotaxis protein MotB